MLLQHIPFQTQISDYSTLLSGGFRNFQRGVQATEGSKAAHSRGVWGHAPPETFVILMFLKWILKHLGHILVV